jgi:hypothetical protein
LSDSLDKGVHDAAQATKDFFSRGSSRPTTLAETWGTIKDNVSNLFRTKDASVDVAGLAPDVKQRFFAMLQEYRALGGKRTIQINSAKRSFEEQARLYQQSPGKAAKPGTSVHELGRAIDINSSDANELDRMGLLQKYGFARPVPNEAWHVQQAGISGMLARQGWSNQDFPEKNFLVPPSISETNAFLGGKSNTTPMTAPFKVPPALQPEAAAQNAGTSPKVAKSGAGGFVATTESIPTLSYLDPGLILTNIGALSGAR